MVFIYLCLDITYLDLRLSDVVKNLNDTQKDAMKTIGFGCPLKMHGLD